jgi:hypothetical protein
MNNADIRPQLVDQGIQFKVIAGFAERECIISKNALAYLGRLQGGSMDFMDTYTRHEEKIHAVARRLVIAGESASPLILGAAYFVSMPAPATS